MRCVAPALVLFAIAIHGCSLVSLDGLTGGKILPVGADSGSMGSDSGQGDEVGPPQSAYAAAVLADSPIAYWRLDETSGTTARDSSGHGNDGTYIGVVSHGTAGAIASDPDTATTFDGATGYMDGGNRFAFTGQQALSLEAWVKANSTTSYLGIASREDTSGGPPSEGYVLFVSPSDGVFGFQRLDGASQTTVTSMSVASASAYVHIVATYDGSQMSIYVNGASELTQTASFPIAGAMNDFVVGAEAGGAEAFFDGAMDEVAVYDHVLTPAQVSTHYMVGTGQGP
jgi:hypothetical protein